MLLRVEVTEADCRAGVRRKPSHCPLALAISRASGSPARVCVSSLPSGLEAWWWFFMRKDGDCAIFGDLPEDAALAAKSYDDGNEMSPFAFDLELPEGT